LGCWRRKRYRKMLVAGKNACSKALVWKQELASKLSGMQSALNPGGWEEGALHGLCLSRPADAGSVLATRQIDRGLNGVAGRRDSPPATASNTWVITGTLRDPVLVTIQNTQVWCKYGPSVRYESRSDHAPGLLCDMFDLDALFERSRFQQGSVRSASKLQSVSSFDICRSNMSQGLTWKRDFPNLLETRVICSYQADRQQRGFSFYLDSVLRCFITLLHMMHSNSLLNKPLEIEQTNSQKRVTHSIHGGASGGSASHLSQ
jgi:hypothetical protein